MKLKLAIVLLCTLSIAPAVLADPDPPPPPTTRFARLIPTYDQDTDSFVGFKVYAILVGGRFDQIHFANGDLIEEIDDHPVGSAEGAKALTDNVIAGHADARVVVRRNGADLTLIASATAPTTAPTTR